MELPPIISVDDHVVEPPDLWQRWLPRPLRERGPRVVRAPYEMLPEGRQRFRVAIDGPETDFWIYESLRAGIETGMASAGLEADRIEFSPISFEEMRPGCHSVPARLADMDLNGVERSMCFPTFTRFCGQTFLWAKDKELALACVQAYNNWMVEEWSGESGGRLIPLCLVPLWDAHLAGAEVRRNAARGVRAVTFCELPHELGLPTLHDRDGYWDPFLSACEETGTVICLHIGSSSQIPTTSADAPNAVRHALTTINCQLSLTDWLLSGQLVRFPNIKVAFSEGQVGWMPYLLERIDSIWTRSYPVHEIPSVITEPPSSYVAERIFGCIFQDDFGIKSRESLGLRQITFEVDYPHQDSTWPNTQSYAGSALSGLSDSEVQAILRDNAIRLFELPESLPDQPTTWRQLARSSRS